MINDESGFGVWIALFVLGTLISIGVTLLTIWGAVAIIHHYY